MSSFKMEDNNYAEGVVGKKYKDMSENGTAEPHNYEEVTFKGNGTKKE